MRRRSILQWIALTAISLAVVFLLSAVVHDDIVSAANNKARPQTQGSLQVLDRDGKPGSECPLKHTEVKAQVSGLIVTKSRPPVETRQSGVVARATLRRT